MSYQDKKVRAIGRLLLMTAVIAVSLAVCLSAREMAEPVLKHVGRHGNGYWIVVSVLATMLPLCVAVGAGLILTSPAQELRFAAWAERVLRVMPASRSTSIPKTPTMIS